METLHWEIKENIGILSLNSPPSNMMDDLFFKEFSYWISDILSRSLLKGVIITGQGRHFSAGSSIENLVMKVKENGGNGAASDYFVRNSMVFSKLKNLPYPVIAAIKGVCIGSALELALCCDIRICGERSMLGLPETTFDLIPGCGGTQVLPKIVGRAKAIEIILNGENLSPEQALECRLVDKVVPNKEVLEAAMHVIKRIQHNKFKELKLLV